MLSGYTLLTQWSGFFFFLSNYVIAFGTGGDVYVKGIYIYIYMNVFWFLISITVGSWVDS